MNNWILQTGGKYDWRIYEDDILKYTLKIKTKFNIFKAYLEFYKELQDDEELFIKLTRFYLFCYEKMKILENNSEKEIELKRIGCGYYIIIDNQDIVRIRMLGFPIPFKKNIGKIYINNKEEAQITYSFFSNKHFQVNFQKKSDINIYAVILLLAYVFNNGAA